MCRGHRTVSPLRWSHSPGKPGSKSSSRSTQERDWNRSDWDMRAVVRQVEEARWALHHIADLHLKYNRDRVANTLTGAEMRPIKTMGVAVMLVVSGSLARAQSPAP